MVINSDAAVQVKGFVVERAAPRAGFRAHGTKDRTAMLEVRGRALAAEVGIAGGEGIGADEAREDAQHRE